MDTEFRLFPRQASSIAREVDNLYWYLITVSAFFTLLIFALIIAFAIRYRRGRPVERPGRNPTQRVKWMIEIGWTIPPLMLVMVMFVWGAALFLRMQQVPAGALEIQVLGKQWMWKLQHPEGHWEINELHVPVGERVRLRMISQDVIHSFFVPDFRMKMDVLPGRYTTAWFEAIQTGEFHLFCTEYCGTGHSAMIGRVIVMERDAYADWLDRQPAEPAAAVGERLVARFQCRSCHGCENPSAPPLEGVFGRRVRLKDGRTVVADEDYLRRSILDPAAHVVAGYEPLMPTFREQIDEEGIFQVLAYLRTLSHAGSTPPDAYAQVTDE